ncbi:hypothetical protein NECID01_1604 [Nematocida sp. AWRm77]|nr:hypothetical protein NECID01_1604 [Nematocida sp. AWRm77]
MEEQSLLHTGGCEEMSYEEKSQYLEGKLDILQKNLLAKREEYQTQRKAVQEEKKLLSLQVEHMKAEVTRLKQELREKNALLVGIKKHKPSGADGEGLDGEDLNGECNGEDLDGEDGDEENGDENVWRRRNSKSQTQSKTQSKTQTTRDGNCSAGIDAKGALSANASSANKERSTNTGENAGSANKGGSTCGVVCREKKDLSIEWILKNLEGGMNFTLQSLSAEKLKLFGRFFKTHFDSMYERDTVLQSIEFRVGETRKMVKTILYLSDRPEIVSQTLPYVFKKHIVPDGHLYIKDVVKILYKTGLTSFLGNTDTIRDIKMFFEECCASKELLYFVEEYSKKSPSAVGRIVSKAYLNSIACLYPAHALCIIERLEHSRVYVSTEEARECIHQAHPDTHFVYAQPQHGLFFFF